MKYLTDLGYEEEIPEEEIEEFLQEQEELKKQWNRFGRRRKIFLEEVRPREYNQLVVTDSLFEAIAPLQEQADRRWRLIIKQMAEAEDVNSYRWSDPQKWVARMGAIRSQAEEIVLAEMIYV